MIIGHEKQWDFLKKKFERNELSHTYLFAGQDQIGKKLFAKEFSEFIGCRFPDLMIVLPENGKEIPISKIREVQKFLSYKSYNGGFKIVVVDDAHLMNQEAQSCFLKTLEEPKGKTLLILISSKSDMLLPTIISRCQIMKFFKPKDLPQNFEKAEKEQKILKELLSIIGSDFSEKFKYAKSIDFEKQNAGEIIYVLQKHLRRQLLEAVSLGLPVLKIKQAINLAEEINNKLMFTNVNPNLALEILLMEL